MPTKKKRKAKRNGGGKLVPLVVILIGVLLILGILYGRKLTEKAEQLVYPTEYEEIVSRYAAEFEVPENLVFAVIRSESGFDPEAESNAGAVGLMQLMPASYEWVCWRLGEETTENGRTDPETNIRCGTYLLSYFHSEFSDWELAIAAYNAGDGRVKNWLNDPEISENGKLKNIPFPETKNYLNKVKNAWEAYDRLSGESNTK